MLSTKIAWSRTYPIQDSPFSSVLVIYYKCPLDDLPTLVQEETIAPSSAKKRKKRKHQHFTPEDKATITRYTSEHGVASTAKRFKEKSLKESTMRDWKDLYHKVLLEKAKAAKPAEV